MPELPGPDRNGDPADTFGGVVPSAETPHRFLITIPPHVRMHTWLPVLDTFPLMLRGRTNGDRETWSTTVAAADVGAFLAAAARLGLTVEEIVGAGSHEAYEHRVGTPGTGWLGAGELDPLTVDLAAETARRAGRSEPLDLVALLRAELGDTGPATGGGHVDGCQYDETTGKGTQP